MIKVLSQYGWKYRIKFNRVVTKKCFSFLCCLSKTFWYKLKVNNKKRSFFEILCIPFT